MYISEDDHQYIRSLISVSSSFSVCVSVLFWTFPTLLFSDSSHFWLFRFPFPLIFPSSFHFLPSNTIFSVFSILPCFISVSVSFRFVIILLWLHGSSVIFPSPPFSDSFTRSRPFRFRSSLSAFPVTNPFSGFSGPLDIRSVLLDFSVVHPDMILDYSDSSLPPCLLVLGYH